VELQELQLPVTGMLIVPAQTPATGGGTQLIIAAQPLLVTLPSEVNLKVKQPEGLLATIVPGEDVPVYVPIKGAAVEVPSWINRKSKLFSVAKEVKATCMFVPGVLEQMVYTNV